MKERPILFSGPMVRALLDGSKTQTRRIVKPQPAAGLNWAGWCITSTHTADEGKATWARGDGPHLVDVHRVRCLYGQPGDRLWVRESFSGPHHRERTPPRDWHSLDEIHYWADGNPEDGDWSKPRPGMFMPRWASRITLEVVSVHVERLQDISEADAYSEGIEQTEFCEEAEHAQPATGALPGRYAYRALWEQINGPDSWAANPWVWVVEFKRL